MALRGAKNPSFPLPFTLLVYLPFSSFKNRRAPPPHPPLSSPSPPHPMQLQGISVEELTTVIIQTKRQLIKNGRQIREALKKVLLLIAGPLSKKYLFWNLFLQRSNVPTAIKLEDFFFAASLL